MSAGAPAAERRGAVACLRRLGGASLIAMASLAWALVGARAQAPADVPAPAIGFADTLARARAGPSVELARLELAQARAARDARSSPISATLKGSYAYSWLDAGGTASAEGRLQPFTLDATLNVVPYGPNHDAAQSAERAVESARMALEDAVAQATIDAASGYLQALRSQQRVALDRDARALAQAVLEHARSQLASGNATPEDVASARLAWLQAQTTLASDQLALDGQLAGLGDLVGGRVAAVAGEPPASVDPAVADGAVERRSDVRAAGLALDAARQDYAAAVRAALPTAAASADLQGGDGTTTWSAGLGYGTSTFQPSVSASLDPAAEPGSAGAAVLDGTRFTVSVALTVPLDAGMGAALDSARFAVTSAERKLARARQLAALAIASAQRTLTGAHLSAALAASQRQHVDWQAEQAQQRFELGLIAEPDVQRARIDARRAALDAAAASDALLIDRLELARALGRDPMEVF